MIKIKREESVSDEIESGVEDIFLPVGCPNVYHYACHVTVATQFPVSPYFTHLYNLIQHLETTPD